MLIERVKGTIDQYDLLDKRDRVIVGVSAGVDSMVLLHLLYRFREEFDLSLVIAHAHHGLRPVESDCEAEFVQKESHRLGLPFESRQFNVREFQRSGGFSLQDAARRLRFEFFHEVLKKYGARKIALGHHADDQVETVLLNLFRGSGLKGLKGMLPIREGRVIRPLLEVRREEIEDFARENAIPYLFDSSNLKGNYLRNRIRLHLIPLIERDYQSGFRRRLLRTSRLLSHENDFLEKEAEKAYKKIVEETDRGIVFTLSSYQSLHPVLQWRVTQKALERMGRESSIDGVEVSDVNLIYRRLQRPPASFLLELSHGLYLEKRYDLILLGKGKAKTIPPFEREIVIRGRTLIPEIGKEVVVEERGWEKTQWVDPSPFIAFFDFEKLDLPLKIRNFRPGDRFQPLGTKGTQKLKEFFIDHKVPKIERPHIPLLISNERIVWIVGYRIDERFKITSHTQKVLRVEFI